MDNLSIWANNPEEIIKFHLLQPLNHLSLKSINNLCLFDPQHMPTVQYAKNLQELKLSLEIMGL
jgi:hypothetical protein